jgi:pimeloyl-ACP methyl ester carboxylesterase
VKLLAAWIVALSAFAVASLTAAGLEGDWQGTLPVETGLRLVLRVTKSPDGKQTATFDIIEQGALGIPVTAVSLDGSTVKFSVDPIRGRYEGKLSDDGKTIIGQWFGPRTPGSFLPLNFQLATKDTAWVTDASPHEAQFVTVDRNINLEVLDWGGTGRALVLLAGLGNNAHVYDQLAPKLTDKYHVYGITRRGFGKSTAPDPTETNYSADRLADDVLEVIAALKIERPVLVGHSIAGEELSSIGSRFPQSIAGLIYLDAGYPYAFYDVNRGDVLIDSNEVRRKMVRLSASINQPESKPLIDELLKTDLPQLTKALEVEKKRLDAMPADELAAAKIPDFPILKIMRAVMAGQQKFTGVKCPTLAIFAVMPLPPPGSKPDPLNNPEVRAWRAASAKAFEAGMPSAKVVRLENANHFVFRSNESEVLSAMNAFIATLGH